MSAPSVRGRIAGRESHLRAADSDREQIADQLRTGHADGRLDLDEFQQRLERCYEAKTFGELSVLVSDLPSQQPEARVPARRRPGVRPGWLLPVIALVFVMMAASASASHHGHHPPFFLIIPVVFLIWRMTSPWRTRWSTGTRGGPGRWA